MPLILNGTTGVSGIDGSAGTPSYVGGDSDTGLWYPAANTLALSTSGSERLRIDSSGNVGIGTTSPSYPLQVVKNANGAQRVLFSNNSSGSAAEAVIAVSNGTAEGSIRVAGTSYGGYGAYTANNTLIYNDTSAITIMADNATNGVIKFATGSNSERMRITSGGNVLIGATSQGAAASGYMLGLQSGGTQTYLSLAKSGQTLDTSGLVIGIDPSSANIILRENLPLTFYTNAAERMRITADGNLLVGQSSGYGGGRLDVTYNGTSNGASVRATSNSIAGSVFITYADRNTTNGSFYGLSYYNVTAGAYRFQVLDSGNVLNTNGSYGTISDIKNKENIVDATPKLDKVKQLKVRNFNLIGSDLKQIGFVAQEFEQVFPSIVEESSDIDGEGNYLGTKTKTIKTTVLIPILVKAIQEQQAMIEELKAKVAALEK